MTKLHLLLENGESQDRSKRMKNEEKGRLTAGNYQFGVLFLFLLAFTVLSIFNQPNMERVNQKKIK